MEINNLQLKKCFNVIKHDFSKLKNIKVAILGVTFKANTGDIRNSCSIYLTKKLLKNKAKINVYDPKGVNSYKKIYGDKVKYYDDISQCISGCEIIIIATEWDIIKKYNFNNINVNKETSIYDFKSCIDTTDKFNSNIKY
ncbi:MAG: UDP binding domain-containing protein [Bacilli bacterium]